MNGVVEMDIVVVVNGREWRGTVPVHEVLSQLLRDRLRLTGTKISCASQVCGACTVLVDGRPVSSCTFLALEANACEVLTVEGLADGDALSPLQEAFVRNVGAQCGFCTAGQLITATSLLREHPVPTREQVSEYMRGNVCRCGCYPAIAQSIHEVAAGG